MKISIIIATFNRAAFIGETLTSIANQTYQDFECIVVDDGSTDDTENILESIVLRDSRFKYVIRPNTVPKGANYSRNYGYSLCDGQLVKFFDSDDLMLPDHLAVSVQYLEKGKYDFVVGDCINFDESGLLERPYKIDRANAILSAMNFAQFKTAWITNDLLVKRELADQLKFASGIRDQASEYQYNIKLLLLTNNGLLLENIITHRRIHDDGFVVRSRKNPAFVTAMNAELFLVTSGYLQNIAEKRLLKWLLSSHIQLTFEMATNQVWPENIWRTTRLWVQKINIKGLFYPFAVTLGYATGKGYQLLKRIRS